jgi:hypothetical protein
VGEGHRWVAAVPPCSAADAERTKAARAAAELEQRARSAERAADHADPRRRQSITRAISGAAVTGSLKTVRLPQTMLVGIASSLIAGLVAYYRLGRSEGEGFLLSVLFAIGIVDLVRKARERSGDPGAGGRPRPLQ